MRRRFENRQSGAILILLLTAVIPSAILSFALVPHVINDDELTAVAKVFLVIFMAIGCGIALPAMVLSSKAYLQIEDDHVLAGVAPLSKTRIDMTAIRAVTVETIDPMSDFKGWGVKGDKKRRLYGYSGNEALVISYLFVSGAATEERQLFFLTDRAKEIAKHLSKYNHYSLSLSKG